MEFKATADMRAFFRDLAKAKDGMTRAIMQFHFEVATAIQAQAQENVKAMFGPTKGGAPRSPLTLRAMGTSGRRQGRGGGLLQSIRIERESNGTLVVVAGGVGVPYAAIHEFGGVIRPRTARYLTIPFWPRYAGRRAREFENLHYDVDEEWGPVLRTNEGSVEDPDDRDIAFLLRRQARIPKRPFLAPAVRTATSAPEIRRRMQVLFGRTIDYEVKAV